MLQDLRFALRQLASRPLFASVAVVTLALGIGATTAIFSVVDTLMLRDLPYPDADRIVTLWQTNAAEGVTRGEVSPGNFFEWRERNQTFEFVAAVEPYSYDLTGVAEPEVLFAVKVTEGFFDAVGIQPLLGRLFDAEHFQPGAGNFGVLTHGLWQRRFGGDPAIVGSSVSLDGEAFVILGVLPPEFELALLGGLGYDRGLWVARQLQGWEPQERLSAWWNVIARLRSGVTLSQAQADLNRVSRGLAAEFPASNANVGVSVVPLHEHLVGGARPALLMLLGAVGIVLLIACVNVANLLLAGGTERAGEFAVRTALGAERGRLVRQLLTEAAVLAIFGGALGMLLAYWGVDLIKSLAPGDIPRIEGVTVDLRILGFGIVTSIVTALVFGVAPASQHSRPDLQGTLKEGRSTAGSGRQRLRGALVTAEVALALTLLIGAGLLLRSFAAIIRVDPGFQPDQLLALQVFAWDRHDSLQQRVVFFEETLQRIRGLPGVRSTGAVSAAPFLAADLDLRTTLVIEGRPAPRQGEEPQVYLTHATADYFRTVGIPIVQGRVFTPRDRPDRPLVAVINESMRRRYWPAEDPIGHVVRVGRSERRVEIVGMVGNVLHGRLDGQPRPEIFLSHAQTGYGGMTYFVRTDGDPRPLLEPVKRQIWTVDPLQAMYEAGVVTDMISDTLTARRFSLVLLGLFAGIAFALAALGIYSLISFAVSRRTHEVGIRMALGADRSDVVRLIVRQGMTLTAVGVILGVIGAIAATRVLSSLLFGIPPRDTVAFSLGIMVLVAGAFVASYLPARRATRVHPMEALRYE
jgi:putative ABC transport system permease protein